MIDAQSVSCHYGDHNWQANGYCDWCYQFNGSWLAWQGYEKAEREGRAHYGHYHRTLAVKEACKRGPDPEWVEAYGDSEVPL